MLSTPYKMDEIFGNFYYNPYWSLPVKFERLIELKLSVWTKFHLILSHSWMKYFALREYYNHLHVHESSSFTDYKLKL